MAKVSAVQHWQSVIILFALLATPVWYFGSHGPGRLIVGTTRLPVEIRITERPNQIPPELFLGKIPVNATAGGSIILRNDTAGAIEITSTKASCGCFVATLGRRILSPHESTSLRVELRDAGNLVGTRVTKSIRVVYNLDKQSRTIVVPVTWDVVAGIVVAPATISLDPFGRPQVIRLGRTTLPAERFADLALQVPPHMVATEIIRSDSEITYQIALKSERLSDAITSVRDVEVIDRVRGGMLIDVPAHVVPVLEPDRYVAIFTAEMSDEEVASHGRRTLQLTKEWRSGKEIIGVDGGTSDKLLDITLDKQSSPRIALSIPRRPNPGLHVRTAWVMVRDKESNRITRIPFAIRVFVK